MSPSCTRREWLAAPALTLASGVRLHAAPASASRVSVARCGEYGSALHPVMRTMLDQLGGLGRLVKGKTVTLKINLTGSPKQRVGSTPAECGAYTHPSVTGTLVRLMDEAGAARVRIVEGCYATSDPLDEFMYMAGWDPTPLRTAAKRVELENTNVLGRGTRYHRRMIPGTGLIFPGFDFNHAYDECDVLVSVAKLKEHATCGITLAMKNMFGATPITIYGDFAGKDEPAADAKGGRGAVMHRGSKAPSKSAPQELNPTGPKDDKWRMPRIVVDVCRALPVHLSVIDGIETLAGGEGSWIRGARPVKPGLLIAGLNPVSTDAVAAALMGFDPMADRGTPPFERCDSFLRLAEEQGLGTRDLSRIEIAGLPISKARFDFRAGGSPFWVR